ncbi:MAG: hypothetical protein FJX20_12245 [Alphaproteobacteria bacterium]|nr:hypothetical protein [Alphaproteobacteria bacterium]
MPPEFADKLKQSIRDWSGVECPNEAAEVGLSDFPGLLKELAALRGTLVFEDEPSSFDAALQAEKEPAR